MLAPTGTCSFSSHLGVSFEASIQEVHGVTFFNIFIAQLIVDIFIITNMF